MLNKVLLIGNLTRDPQLRYLPSGTAVADFGLAVNRRYRTQDGQQKEEVLFVDISVMGRQAETCAEYLSKGRQALIEGRLQLQEWETQDGQKRSKLRVVGERVQFMGARGGAAAGPAGGAAKGAAEGTGQRPAAAEEPPADPEMSGDDVPF